MISPFRIFSFNITSELQAFLSPSTAKYMEKLMVCWITTLVNQTTLVCTVVKLSYIRTTIHSCCTDDYNKAK